MNRYPQIFAHRGARAKAPENTLPAFELALDMGVEGVELDVHCSRDGKLVVIHDDVVDTTTDCGGKVGDYTAAELAKMDAGSHFGTEFAGVGVPTLVQVLDLVGKRCRINIELKSDDPMGGDQVEPLVELIRARNLYEQVIVSSFNPPSLIKMRWFDDKVALGLLYHRALPVYLRRAWLSPIIAPEALHPYHTLIDAPYMAWAKEHGHAVNTWTVNDVAEAQRLAGLGVDVIMSDVPDQIIAALSV